MPSLLFKWIFVIFPNASILFPMYYVKFNYTYADYYYNSKHLGCSRWNINITTIYIFLFEFPSLLFVYYDLNNHQIIISRERMNIHDIDLYASTFYQPKEIKYLHNFSFVFFFITFVFDFLLYY